MKVDWNEHQAYVDGEFIGQVSTGHPSPSGPWRVWYPGIGYSAHVATQQEAKEILEAWARIKRGG